MHAAQYMHEITSCSEFHSYSLAAQLSLTSLLTPTPLVVMFATQLPSQLPNVLMEPAHIYLMLCYHRALLMQTLQ